MIATVYLKPCPICPKGKNCRGHVQEARPAQWPIMAVVQVIDDRE